MAGDARREDNPRQCSASCRVRRSQNHEAQSHFRARDAARPSSQYQVHSLSLFSRQLLPLPLLVLGSANTKPSRFTISPSRCSIGFKSIGPSNAKVWKFPARRRGSTAAGSSAKRDASTYGPAGADQAEQDRRSKYAIEARLLHVSRETICWNSHTGKTGVSPPSIKRFFHDSRDIL